MFGRMKLYPRTLSELHGARWPGFDGEEMVKAVMFSQAAAKLSISFKRSKSCVRRM